MYFKCLVPGSGPNIPAPTAPNKLSPMNPEDPSILRREPVPGDSSQLVTARVEDGKQNPDADVSAHDTRTEQAKTATEQAKTGTEQANTGTAQAKIGIEQAKTGTEQAKTGVEQAETRTQQASTATEQAETRTRQARTGGEQAQTRTMQATARIQLAEARTHQAEQRALQVESRSQMAIRASELSYRRLFESARDGILILEVDTGRISDANPFLVELLGFSREEMVGKTVAELSPFRDIVSNQTMLARLQQDGYVRYEDLPLETRDGRHIAVEFVCNVYQAGDKKVIQCNIRDITERKQADAALNRLASLVESSADAIIGKDLQGIITSWNKGAQAAFGYTAEEMVGTSIMRLIPADRHAEETQILEVVRRGESVENLETLRLAKDGRLIDVQVSASPVRDAAGKVIGISKVAHAITERKAAEEKIRLLNAELEQRVVERTSQLQAANQELEAFSYSVSHDLRAPLRHVVGFVELLQKDTADTLSDKSLRYLATISSSAKRMGDLIDDLLDFSRVGRSEMLKTEIDLNHLVAKTISELQDDTKGRDIVWKIGQLPSVWADRPLLRQVLFNLICNAVKFTTKRAEAVIEIGTAPGAAGETVFFVGDNGAGFDSKYADKLFRVFQRLHSQNEFEGTGIGLANVQRIIQRHGGWVRADGVVDGGATFYFSLPIPDERTHGSSKN